MNAMTFKLSAALVAATFIFSTNAHALDQKPVLTLDMANQIVAACVALATAEEWRPVNVAVFDDGGNLKAFQRMDNAFLGSIQIAQMKGHTSTVFPLPTRVVAELAYGKDGEPGLLPGISEIPGIAAFPGGVPIMTGDGHQLGGVGVSGASGDQDEQCAQTGIAAIASMLK
jgi:uncharacterized protein GlcG (DUF336 family)